MCPICLCVNQKIIKMADLVEKSLNFIEEIIEKDLETGKHKTIITRFPPEPNSFSIKNLNS